jgi:hypothetical protein
MMEDFGDDAGLAIAVDDSGYVYVTGNSHGTQTRRDLVVFKILQIRSKSMDTKSLQIRLIITSDQGFAIKLDEMNNIIIGGIGVYKI